MLETDYVTCKYTVYCNLIVTGAMMVIVIPN